VRQPELHAPLVDAMFVRHDREPRRAVLNVTASRLRMTSRRWITAIASSNTRVAATSNLPARRRWLAPFDRSSSTEKYPRASACRLLSGGASPRLGASAGLRRCAERRRGRAGAWGSVGQASAHPPSGQSVEKTSAV
jgi:hypothetical protein